MGRGKQRSAPAREPAEQVGEARVGGEIFPLYQGLLVTTAAVLGAAPDVIRRAYVGRFQPMGLICTLRAARQVIAGLVQNEWYTQQGKEIPMTVKEQQAKRERTAEEKAADTEAAVHSAHAAADEVAARGERPRNKKKAIRVLMAGGATDDQIYEQLKPGFRTLIRADIRWCRAHPLRGDLA